MALILVVSHDHAGHFLKTSVHVSFHSVGLSLQIANSLLQLCHGTIRPVNNENDVLEVKSGYLLWRWYFFVLAKGVLIFTIAARLLLIAFLFPCPAIVTCLQKISKRNFYEKTTR